MNSVRSSLAGLLLALVITFLVLGSVGSALGAPLPHQDHFSDSARLESTINPAPAHPNRMLHWFTGLGLIGMAAGVVTYRTPASVAGATVAPTAAQATNLVVADVAMADASTVTTITHNLSGVSTNGADGSPLVHIMTTVAGATPVGSGVTVGFTTNAITITNYTTAAGNGQTYRVQIWRHSLVSNFTK